jgi:hypothetical protein
MPKKVTRKMAKAKGLTRYFTGGPCKRGHLCERQTGSHKCIECKRITDGRYSHSQKRQACLRRYNHSEKRHIVSRRYQQSPKGKETERRARRSPFGRDTRWRLNHSPKGRERVRRQNNSIKGQDAKWRYNNSEKGQEYQRNYQRAYGRLLRVQTRLRAYHLERIEATYRDNPTETNWTRLQNIYARRHRDGR